MKTIAPYTGFEQGPIRPPSEAESLLIRVTRNCPWNRCSFCAVYKGTQFSRRPVEHVLKDIDTVRQAVDLILEAKEQKRPLSEHFDGKEEEELQALYAAYHFIAGNMESIFLQDANSLLLKPDDLVCILEHIKKTFPQIKRITSYARSSTVARIEDSDLQRLAQAGLNRVHIGMESCSDEVLQRVNKGTDKASQICAGQKIKRAGIELSEYYIPGLGGKDLWQENALETADAMNQINPDFIRLRTLALPPRAPLTRQFKEGQFAKMGEVDTARELLLFLDSLQGITSAVKSDHILNLFTEVNGILPKDKERMALPIRTFLNLESDEQILFIMGRRAHCFVRLNDLANQELRGNAQKVCDELGVTSDNIDIIIDSILQRYI